MASALSTIHNPRNDMNLGPKRKYGRHGDIKSENILWYPPSEQNPRGHLVIADLGLTAFNSTRSRSNIPGESIPPSPDYRPPECDLAGGKGVLLPITYIAWLGWKNHGIWWNLIS
jgi:serine/threonine protein kinase